MFVICRSLLHRFRRRRRKQAKSPTGGQGLPEVLPAGLCPLQHRLLDGLHTSGLAPLVRLLFRRRRTSPIVASPPFQPFDLSNPRLSCLAAPLSPRVV